MCTNCEPITILNHLGSIDTGAQIIALLELADYRAAEQVKFELLTPPPPNEAAPPRA